MHVRQLILPPLRAPPRSSFSGPSNVLKWRETQGTDVELPAGAARQRAALSSTEIQFKLGQTEGTSGRATPRLGLSVDTEMQFVNVSSQPPAELPHRVALCVAAVPVCFCRASMLLLPQPLHIPGAPPQHVQGSRFSICETRSSASRFSYLPRASLLLPAAADAF
jgi:hypothetical protein